MDDFILATPDRAVAMAFLKLMRQGISSYGCEINEGKTQVLSSMRWPRGQLLRANGGWLGAHGRAGEL